MHICSLKYLTLHKFISQVITIRRAPNALYFSGLVSDYFFLWIDNLQIEIAPLLKKFLIYPPFFVKKTKNNSSTHTIFFLFSFN